MKTILLSGERYTPYEFANEDELQQSVIDNVESIFGNDAIWISGARLGGKRNEKRAKGQPDGFIIHIESSTWTIVEVELAKHPLHDHIVSQISRFNGAYKKDRKKIIDHMFEECKDSKEILEKLEQYGIDKEIHRFITETIEKTPTITILIDEDSEELEDVMGSLPFKTAKSIVIPFRSERSSRANPIIEYDALNVGSSNARAGKKRDRRKSTIRALVFLGKRVTFTHSKEIPVLVAEELIRTGKFKTANAWGPGKKRFLINKVPTHPEGNDFFSPMPLSNGWWVETHASEPDNLRHAKYLIEYCGVKDNDIHIES
jgi:hypothetical protein